MDGMYRDEQGFVGDPDVPVDLIAAADEAMRGLRAAAEALATLADRCRGDSGDDVDAIEGWCVDAERLCEQVRVALGEPRVLRHGVLVPARMVR
jgi:hypothetical protein